jgi:hypothetical protein
VVALPALAGLDSAAVAHKSRKSWTRGSPLPHSAGSRQSKVDSRRSPQCIPVDLVKDAAKVPKYASHKWPPHRDCSPSGAKAHTLFAVLSAPFDFAQGRLEVVPFQSRLPRSARNYISTPAVLPQSKSSPSCVLEMCVSEPCSAQTMQTPPLPGMVCFLGPLFPWFLPGPPASGLCSLGWLGPCFSVTSASPQCLIDATGPPPSEVIHAHR